MGTPRLTPELRRKKPSAKSLYAAILLLKFPTGWAFMPQPLQMAAGPSNLIIVEQHARDLLDAQSEIRKLWAQLKRTEEERDILKKAARYFAKEPD